MVFGIVRRSRLILGFESVSLAAVFLTLSFGGMMPSQGAETKHDQSLILKLEDMKVPKGFISTPEKVELGKTLFFDPRLSSNATVSCNSCHNVMAGGDDGQKTSFGVNSLRGTRSAPTVWNSGFLSVQFWDGREDTLEGQAKGPIINPVEMAMKDHNVAVKNIAALEGYKTLFSKVYKEKPSSRKLITIDRIVDAIAAYERTLVTLNSPFDRFIAGDDKAISTNAKKGWETFQRVGCTACHTGSNFAGPSMPLGVGFYQKFPLIPSKEFDQLNKKYDLTSDHGRNDVTKQEADKNMWRVPTLRNIAATAPYFHNGAVDSLPEAVRVMGRAQLGKSLSNSEVKQIVEFLKTLSGEFPEQKLPKLPLATVN